METNLAIVVRGLCMLMVICGLLQLLSDVDEVSLLAEVSESCEMRHAKTKKICISKKSV